MAEHCPLCGRDPALQTHLGAMEDALGQIEHLLLQMVVRLAQIDRERRTDHYGVGRAGMPKEDRHE